MHYSILLELFYFIISYIVNLLLGLIYKLDHRYTYVGKNIVFVEFSTVNIVWVQVSTWGLRIHPLWVKLWPQCVIL